MRPRRYSGYGYDAASFLSVLWMALGFGVRRVSSHWLKEQRRTESTVGIDGVSWKWPVKP